MAEDGYNRNSIIGGYKGAPIKQSMLGKNLKTRGALSNNLPFRLANGLAPGMEYQFLFPTGTEKGAVWRFSQSGEQQQSPATATGPGTFAVTAVGQSIGVQQDSRLAPVAHSLNLNARAWTYGGTGANTIGISSDTLTFNNSPANDYAAVNAEFPAAEWGRLEAVIQIDAPSAVGNQFYFFLGNSGNLISTVAGRAIYTLQGLGSVNGLLQFQAFNNVPGIATVKVLSITGYPGNHLSQATSTSRPLIAIETVGQWGQSVYSGRFDGVDDGMITPSFVAGTLTNNMDLVCAVKRNSATKGALFTSLPGDSNKTIGFFESGNPGVTSAGVGAAFSIFVDGIAVANNCDTLFTALPVSSWHVVEFRGLDLSTWTQISTSTIASYVLNANYGDTVLCPAQSTANRNLARTLVGASVGLLL